MISAVKLEEMFDEAVPYVFQKDVAQVIHKSYGDADTIKNLFGLQMPISKWNLPYIRRAIIQSQLFELAARWDLKAEWCNTASGGNPYVQIQAGQFILTESMVTETEQLPRYAIFRTANSMVNYSLFPEDEENTTDSIYVMATHVPKFGEPVPAHLGFTFPDADYSRSLHRIDLHSRFFGSSGATGGSDSKDQSRPSDPQPTLRDPNKEKKNQGGSA